MGYGTVPVANGEGGGGGRDRPGGVRGGQRGGEGEGLKNWSSQRQALSDEEALASAQVGGRGVGGGLFAGMSLLHPVSVCVLSLSLSLARSLSVCLSVCLCVYSGQWRDGESARGGTGSMQTPCLLTLICTFVCICV